MKRLIVFTWICALLVSLTACGAFGSTSGSLAGSSSAVLSQSTSSSAASVLPEEQLLQGILCGVGMSSTTIEDANGTQYTFSNDGLIADMPVPLEEGDEVRLTYLGQLVDGSTENCTLLKIERIDKK